MGYASAASIVLKKNKGYLKGCKLSIDDQRDAYDKFREKISVPAVRVVYFDMWINGTQLFNKTEYLYAWSRATVGEPVFSLPIDYISACLFLPLIFYDRLQINVIESKEGCLTDVSGACRQQIVFQTLIDFTQVNRCNNETCDTICNRRFDLNDLLPFHEEEYSCCEVTDFHINFTDLNSCVKRNPVLVFPQLNEGITTVSISAIIPHICLWQDTTYAGKEGNAI